MSEDEVVVVRIVGDDLIVERHRSELRSVRVLRRAVEELAEVVDGVRPHLVMWSAADERGRRLAMSLRERMSGGGWVPGCAELPAWTDVPFGEILKLLGRAKEEAARPRLEVARPEGAAERDGETSAPEGAPEVGATASPVPGEAGADLGERLELVLAARARRRRA